MKVTGLKKFFNSVKAKDNKQFVIIAKGVRVETIKEFIECVKKTPENRTYILFASRFHFASRYEDLEIEFIEM